MWVVCHGQQQHDNDQLLRILEANFAGTCILKLLVSVLPSTTGTWNCTVELLGLGHGKESNEMDKKNHRNNETISLKILLRNVALKRNPANHINSCMLNRFVSAWVWHWFPQFLSQEKHTVCFGHLLWKLRWWDFIWRSRVFPHTEVSDTSSEKEPTWTEQQSPPPCFFVIVDGRNQKLLLNHSPSTPTH